MRWIKAIEFPESMDLSRIDIQLHEDQVTHRFTMESGHQYLWLLDGPDNAQVISNVQAWVHDPSLMNGGEPKIEKSETRGIGANSGGEAAVAQTPSHMSKTALGGKPAPLTLLLVALCFVGAALYSFEPRLLAPFTFWDIDNRLSFGESIFRDILAGDYWRLLTPIFLHFGFAHAIFNALWLWFLGTQIEREGGVRTLLVLVVIIGVVSNVAQLLVTGSSVELVGGMSGVVYGLFAYVWLAKKINPRLNYQITDAIFVFMTVFMLLSPLGIFNWFLGDGGDIADTAHFSGYITGLLLAAASRFLMIKREKMDGV